jgi:tetratricopeptide (TPR) repeat protein
VYADEDRAAEAERAVRSADRLPAYDPYFDPTFDDLVHESRSSTFLLQQASAADVSTNAPWREYLIRRAHEFDPENTDALYELASLLRVLRRYDEALQLLQRHQQLVPGDLQALTDIGRCLAGLNLLPEAESVLRRALTVRDDAGTHYDLGFVLDRTGRLDQAIAEYERAIERNPNHKEALNNLAIDLARQGKMAPASRVFERLTAVDPDNADARTNYGLVLQARGERDQAAREFRRALDVNPDHTRARDALAALDRR